MLDPIDRYRKLNLEESLAQFRYFQFGCEELSLILRLAYNRVSKNLQSLIFQDILTAFRFLTDMQTSGAISAVHQLLKSAEATLPKQKKNLAVSEFKHAKVALKRRLKARKEETGSVQLPHDVLVHIFGFLDMQSIVSSGLVCWSWNLATMDKHLWQLQYSIYFGDCKDDSKSEVLQGVKKLGYTTSQEELVHQTDGDWKGAFKKAYAGSSSKLLRFRRGYCGNCHTIVWHDRSRCPNEQCRSKSRNRCFRLVSPLRVVNYILEGSFSESSSSDSDSESDEEPGLRNWAFSSQF